MDADGNVLSYKKQILMLIDEFSTSTADSVPGMLRDANRVSLYGMRTNGAGGNNTSFDAGSYSEGVTGMTLALQTRKEKHLNGDYPYTDLIENTGVWPDITDDYMTKDNLLQNGAPFVQQCPAAHGCPDPHVPIDSHAFGSAGGASPHPQRLRRPWRSFSRSSGGICSRRSAMRCRQCVP